MDLTLDIYESIRDAVEAIAEDEGTGFAEAYALFARSKTYEALANAMPAISASGSQEGNVGAPR